MSRSLKRDIPGPDWRRSLEAVQEQGALGVFAPELRSPRALVVEIGFGRGEYLQHLAESDPETAYLGIELSNKRVTKMARRLAQGELRNVRIVEGRAEQVLEEALAPQSVDAFWINFPDPWPKKRHAARRLVRPAVMEILSTRLRPGGAVQLATDHVAYAEQIHEVLSKQALLENLHAPRSWVPEVPGRLHTAYEREWRAEGRSLHFFAYRRLSNAI